MGYDKVAPRLYLANGVVMLFVFVAVRNVGGAWASYRYWEATSEVLRSNDARISERVVWTYRVANLLLSALNAHWGYKMVRGCIRAAGKILAAKPKTR